jgi:hypothetical protein
MSIYKLLVMHLVVIQSTLLVLEANVPEIDAIKIMAVDKEKHELGKLAFHLHCSSKQFPIHSFLRGEPTVKNGRIYYGVDHATLTYRDEKGALHDLDLWAGVRGYAKPFYYDINPIELPIAQSSDLKSTSNNRNDNGTLLTADSSTISLYAVIPKKLIHTAINAITKPAKKTDGAFELRLRIPYYRLDSKSNSYQLAGYAQADWIKINFSE